MSSDAAEVLGVLAEIARQRRPELGPIRREQRLIEDLGLDSLDRMELAVALEDRFEVALSEDDEEAIGTVGDLVDTIVRLAAAR